MNEQDRIDLEPYRWTCERSLDWHGNRKAADFLADIPADLEPDRYGFGGAVAAGGIRFHPILERSDEAVGRWSGGGGLI